MQQNRNETIVSRASLYEVYLVQINFALDLAPGIGGLNASRPSRSDLLLNQYLIRGLLGDYHGPALE